MPLDSGAWSVPGPHARTRALSLAGAVIAAGVACGPTAPPPADLPARTLAVGLQDRIDRFARVERPGPHRLRITLQEKARTRPTQVDLERLAQTVARGAFDVRAAMPGDSVIVVVQRRRRFGPFAWDGSATRYTFTARPLMSNGGLTF